MKKVLLPITLFFAAITATSAQTVIGPEAVSSAGAYYSGAWGSLQVNIGGEPAIETLSSANNHFTQGFEQPKFIGTGIISTPANAPVINLYPNPSNDVVNLQFTLTQPGKLSYRIFDMAGRALNGTSHTTQTGQQTEQLDLSSLSQGMYMLNIVFEAGDNTKSFSVVKRFEVVK